MTTRTDKLMQYTDSRARGLCRADVELFAKLVRANPHKNVRVYSYQGFVPNAYKWRSTIEWIERDRKTGQITIGRSGAQRSYGRGPHATVARREVA